MTDTGKSKVTTPSDREVEVTRTFNAPRRLVYDAHTKPDLIKRWLLGPPGWSMPVCEVDLRVGGRYRYVWRNDDGSNEFGLGGSYREIVAPERLVTTEKFEGADMPGEATSTLLLTEKAGVTTLVLRMLFPSKEIRDGALATGMTGGMEQSYARLESMLPSMAG